MNTYDQFFNTWQANGSYHVRHNSKVKTFASITKMLAHIEDITMNIQFTLNAGA